MIRIALLLSCAAALAACSSEPSPTAAGDETAPTPAATVAETASAAPTPKESVTPSPGPTAALAIPAAIQGRWGLVPADCTSPRGDAKGLLTIDATTLKFYESRATLELETARGDAMIRGQFEFNGEGQTWTRDMALQARDGGKTLTRSEYGDDALPGPLKYARCPA